MKKTIDYRHGKVSYLDNDLYIGRALSLYGEREEEEVQFVLSLVKEGDVVIDVGANIGMLTIPLARKVGVIGAVHAFEPQHKMYWLLHENVLSFNNVFAYPFALGASRGRAAIPDIDYDKQDNFGGVSLVVGDQIDVGTLDELELLRCNLIKIDVEGMEYDVLKGAENTIKKFKPLLYVENDRREKSAALIAAIHELGYEMYWHTPALFNPDNYAGNKENIFYNVVAVNMLCVPKEKSIPQTSGLRRVVTVFDQANGAPMLPDQVKPANGWAGVARFGGIGDNLIAASAIGALKRKGFKVEVITSQDCAWQVFQHNPNIDKLSVKTKSEIPIAGLEWQKWFRGRADEFDTFAHLSHSCEGLLAFFQASTQFHWPAHVRRAIANKNYLEMAHDIAGVGYDFGPLFYSSEAERKGALESKAKLGERVICIAMSGSRNDKLHPALPILVSRLIKEVGLPVALTGDPGRNFKDAAQIEKAVIDANGSSKGLHVAISSDPDANGNRAINWPIRRSLSFAQVCDIVIGPDTGLMWAVAFEAMPKIMLLGHASQENITKHWVNTITLHADKSVPCWPCHQLHDSEPGQLPPYCTPNPQQSGAACISSISVETIIERVKTLLANNQVTGDGYVRRPQDDPPARRRDETADRREQDLHPAQEA
jgi:FkbM family methyltransferase